MSFRLQDQNPQYFSNDGTTVLAGGSLTFSDSGSTTPLDTYSDPDLTTVNPNPVVLDASGRATTDIWCEGDYRVVLADATGAVIWTRDYTQVPGGQTAPLPLPSAGSGKFLSSDGTSYIWATVQSLPSVAGQQNKVLGNDGTNLIWQNPPSAGSDGTNGTNADVTVTASSVKWSNGTGDLFYIQNGTGSAPASGSHTTSTTITFPVAFKSAPSFVGLSVTSTTMCSAGYLLAYSVTGITTTGFSVSFDSNSSDGGNGNVIASVPFAWSAQGTIAS